MIKEEVPFHDTTREPRPVYGILPYKRPALPFSVSEGKGYSLWSNVSSVNAAGNAQLTSMGVRVSMVGYVGRPAINLRAPESLF